MTACCALQCVVVKVVVQGDMSLLPPTLMCSVPLVLIRIQKVGSLYSPIAILTSAPLSI